MACQEARNRLRILLLAIDPELQRFDAAQQQEAIKGAERAALGILQKIDLLGQRLVLRHNNSGGYIMVAAKELGRRVQNNVCSEIERILKIGRHGTVIHAQQRSVRVGKFRHAAQIDYAQQRIGG